MSLFKREENQNERTYKECLDLFNNSKDNEQDKNEHDDIIVLYKEIKNHYEKKIELNEININAERIRIERDLGKYSANYANIMMNLSIGLISGLFVLFFDKTDIFDAFKLTSVPAIIAEPLIILLKVVTFLIILYVILKSTNDKSVRINKNTSIIYNISLKVLDDIEKEINESQFRNSSSIDEVASTTEDAVNN